MTFMNTASLLSLVALSSVVGGCAAGASNDASVDTREDVATNADALGAGGSSAKISIFRRVVSPPFSGSLELACGGSTITTDSSQPTVASTLGSLDCPVGSGVTATCTADNLSASQKATLITRTFYPDGHAADDKHVFGLPIPPAAADSGSLVFGAGGASYSVGVQLQTGYSFRFRCGVE